MRYGFASVVASLCVLLGVAAAAAEWLLWSEYADSAGLIDPNHAIGAFETIQLCERAIDKQGAALKELALSEVGTIFHRLGNNPSSTTFIVSPESGPATRWDMTCLPDTVDPRK